MKITKNQWMIGGVVAGVFLLSSCCTCGGVGVWIVDPVERVRMAFVRTAVMDSIRQKEGVEVKEVVMVKKNEREYTGYVVLTDGRKTTRCEAVRDGSQVLVTWAIPKE